MNFREALSLILQQESAELAGNPFWLYSRLSDLCRSYIDRQKIALLFAVDKRLHIVGSIMTDGKIAEATLKVAYPAVKNIITAESYKKLIACVAEVACPAVKKKPQTATAKVKIATIQRAEEEEQEEPRTVLYHKPKYALWWTVAIGIAALIIAGIVCLSVFGKYINWNGWQHIIGSIGGILISSLIIFLVCFFDWDTVRDKAWPKILILLAAAAVNCVLYYFLSDSYKIIFIWLSAYEVFWGSFLVLISFTEYEICWAVAEIVETVVILATMVLGLILL